MPYPRIETLGMERKMKHDPFDVDKKFRRMERNAMLWMSFCGLITVACLGFAGWVIFRLLVHFGVA